LSDAYQEFWQRSVVGWKHALKSGKVSTVVGCLPEIMAAFCSWLEARPEIGQGFYSCRMLAGNSGNVL